MADRIDAAVEAVEVASIDQALDVVAQYPNFLSCQCATTPCCFAASAASHRRRGAS
jgi:hypothetical protein